MTGSLLCPCYRQRGARQRSSQGQPTFARRCVEVVDLLAVRNTGRNQRKIDLHVSPTWQNAMLGAFFDDSGTHSGSQAVAMGAFSALTPNGNTLPRTGPRCSRLLTPTNRHCRTFTSPTAATAQGNLSVIAPQGADMIAYETCLYGSERLKHGANTTFTARALARLALDFPDSCAARWRAVSADAENCEIVRQDLQARTSGPGFPLRHEIRIDQTLCRATLRQELTRGHRCVAAIDAAERAIGLHANRITRVVSLRPRRRGHPDRCTGTDEKSCHAHIVTKRSPLTEYAPARGSAPRHFA